MADRCYEKENLKMNNGLIYHVGRSEKVGSAPKHAVDQKKEHVFPRGGGHEASGSTGDDGNADKEKKDHGGGGSGGGGGGRGGGGGGGRGGGGGGEKKKRVFCKICEHFFAPEEFENHFCKSSTEDY